MQEERSSYAMTNVNGILLIKIKHFLSICNNWMEEATSYHLERGKFSNLLDSPQEVFKLLQPRRN